MTWRGFGDVTSDIQSSASKYGVPASLALAVATKESGLNQAARGAAGEIGVFQLMPATAAGLNVDPFDLGQNIDGAMRLLSQLHSQYGDWNTAVVAYNEGPGNLASRGVFPASQAYADSILGSAGDFSDSSPSDFAFTGPTSLFDTLGVSLDGENFAGLSGAALAAAAVALIAGLVFVSGR